MGSKGQGGQRLETESRDARIAVTATCYCHRRDHVAGRIVWEAKQVGSPGLVPWLSLEELAK